MRTTKIFEVTAENFASEVLQSPLPVLVEFTAEWCPPCKMLAPILDELSVKYENQLRIGSVDGDKYVELAEQLDVYGYPTMILFRDGAPLERIVGYTPRPKLEAKFTPYLHGIESGTR
jgi:thioredoxin 1